MYTQTVIIIIIMIEIDSLYLKKEQIQASEITKNLLKLMVYFKKDFSALWCSIR